MKRRWAGFLVVAACATAVTTTTISPTTTVELIPSSTVTVDLESTTSSPSSTTETVTSPVEPVITLAPPLVTAVATTTTITTITNIINRPPTIPTSPPITIAPAVTVVFSAPAEALLTASTNLVRTSVGLPALIHHADLDFYARVWAGHLSQVGDLSHSNISSLLGPWLIVGENVAAGTDMGQVAAALANSPDHYQTMVNPAYFHTGVGVAVDPLGKLWVCQVFGGTVLP